jgi:AmmeMemoRadiSam system protein B
MIQTTVRKSAVAGFWYPGDPLQLVREVGEHLRAVQPFPFSLPGRLVGLISPHAGLKYSGPVAAYGFALLKNRASATVVMVGPSHRAVYDGVAVYSRGAFETPLGRVPVAEDLADALIAADPRLYAEPRPHRDEHSLEMQLPFLQQTVADLKIVPMLMGSQSRAEISALTGALARVLPTGGTCCSWPPATSPTTTPPPSRTAWTPRWWPRWSASTPRPSRSGSTAATSAPVAAGPSWR